MTRTTAILCPSAKASPHAAPYDAGLSDWVNAGMDDARVKVFVGLRGSNTLDCLLAVRDGLCACGMDEARLVLIDFEDARFRRLKTADDVLDYLGRLPPSAAPRYLFLVSVCRIMRHTALLRTLQGRSGEWNVWVAASTAHVVGEGDPFTPYPWMVVRRIWTDLDAPRAPDESKFVWGQVFLDAVARSVRRPDVRALGSILEYLSDHLAERTTLREAAQGLAGFGYELSANSVRFYRQVLEQCFIIDASECYDVFERRVLPKCGVRLFWTDLGLRAWRFGPAETFEAERVALNRLYLQLRWTHADVYTPIGSDADFVTVEPDGELREWRVNDGKTLDFRAFRAVYGGGGVFSSKEQNEGC